MTNNSSLGLMCLLCLTAFFAQAQIRTDLNNVQKADPLNNHLKIGFSSFLVASPSISYERTFNDKAGLFVGVGALTPYAIFPELDQPDRVYPTYFIGGRTRIAPLSTRRPFSPLFLNLMYRVGRFSETHVRKEILIGTSIQMKLTNALAIETKTMVGYNMEQSHRPAGRLAFAGILNLIYSF